MSAGKLYQVSNSGSNSIWKECKRFHCQMWLALSDSNLFTFELEALKPRQRLTRKGPLLHGGYGTCSLSVQLLTWPARQTAEGCRGDGRGHSFPMSGEYIVVMLSRSKMSFKELSREQNQAWASWWPCQWKLWRKQQRQGQWPITRGTRAISGCQVRAVDRHSLVTDSLTPPGRWVPLCMYVWGWWWGSEGGDKWWWELGRAEQWTHRV